MPGRLFLYPAGMMVDAAGAAKLLAVSTAHFYAMKKAGKFGPAPVRLGRAVRYRVAEIEAWVAAGCPRIEVWQARKAGLLCSKPCPLRGS